MNYGYEQTTKHFQRNIGNMTEISWNQQFSHFLYEFSEKIEKQLEHKPQFIQECIKRTSCFVTKNKFKRFSIDSVMQ